MCVNTLLADVCAWNHSSHKFVVIPEKEKKKKRKKLALVFSILLIRFFFSRVPLVARFMVDQ